MIRGRKSKSNNFDSDWERIFNKNCGQYLQLIITELSNQPNESISTNINTSVDLVENIQKQNKKVHTIIKPDEIPFKIPHDWTWYRLGEIGVCRTGTTPPTVDLDNFGNDIPFIKPADITLKGINYANEGLSFKGVNKGVLIPKGSLLMVCIGGSIGKSYYNSRDVSCNQQINTITPFEGISAVYLQFFLQSGYFQKAIWAKVSGGTTPIVNRSKWESILIPLPSSLLQNKILNFLDDFEKNIIKNDSYYFNKAVEQKVFNIHRSQVKNLEIQIELTHQLDLVKQLRQQLSQDAIQGKLVPQNPDDEPAVALLQKIKAEKERVVKEKKLKKEKELPPIKVYEVPFEIPENWVWCRLGEIAGIKRGKGPTYAEKGISKMLNQKCIRWYVVDAQHSKAINEDWFNSLSEDYIVRSSDVLINSTGDGTIGRSAIANIEVDGFVFDSHILKVRSSINQKYICYFINSEFGQKLVESSKGATSTKQTELGVNNLSNFSIPVPPIAEQQLIVQKLDDFLQTCDELEASIKQSQQQNEQLLQQVLREALNKEVEIEKQPFTNETAIEIKEDTRYKSLLLAAEIIWQLNQKQTLGHLKLQKLIFLCERTRQMNLHVSFLKHAMGPYDPKLQRYLDKELEARQWFSYDENAPLKYQMLPQAGDHKADFKKYFKEDSEAIHHLINLFENATSARIEVVATLFHCWEDMLKNNQLVNDNSLLAEFYNYSTRKEKYENAMVINGLRWMEGHGIVPN